MLRCVVSLSWAYGAHVREDPVGVAWPVSLARSPPSLPLESRAGLALAQEPAAAAEGALDRGAAAAPRARAGCGAGPAARPGDVRADVLVRAAARGARGARRGRRQARSSRRRSDRHGQGREDPHGPGRRPGARGAAALARCARAARRRARARTLGWRAWWADRTARRERAAEGARETSRCAHAGPPARAAPFVRLARAAILAGSARGAGNARPFQHLDHAGVHAPGLSGARQGVRRGASAREEKMIVLKRGREKSLRRRHPWIFSGAIEKVEGNPASGDTVELRSADGQALALAAWSPQSQIRARVWSFDPAERIDAAFLRARVERAAAPRSALPASRHTNAMRLVHGESDGLPGLVVDRYADVLVAQFLAAGAERWREPVLDVLAESTGCEAIYQRSDAEVRMLRGLWPGSGFAPGNRDARRCPIIEYGLNFRVDVEAGQKTGFFLDQRENRQRVRALAAGREVLDCFAYTGGFSIAALAGDAKRVLAVETSSPALEVARENLAANPFDAPRLAFMQP